MQENIVIRKARLKEIRAISSKMPFVFENPKKQAVFIALHGRKIVGIVECGVQKNCRGIVSGIFVLPDYRKKNIGHKLLGKAHSFFETSGIVVSEAVTLKGKVPFFAKARYKEFKNHSIGSTMGRISPKALRRK